MLCKIRVEKYPVKIWHTKYVEKFYRLQNQCSHYNKNQFKNNKNIYDLLECNFVFRATDIGTLFTDIVHCAESLVKPEFARGQSVHLKSFKVVGHFWGRVRSYGVIMKLPIRLKIIFFKFIKIIPT